MFSDLDISQTVNIKEDISKLCKRMKGPIKRDLTNESYKNQLQALMHFKEGDSLLENVLESLC